MNECEEMNNIERWTAVVFGRGSERCVKGSAESSKLTGESPELVRAANQVVGRWTKCHKNKIVSIGCRSRWRYQGGTLLFAQEDEQIGQCIVHSASYYA